MTGLEAMLTPDFIKALAPLIGQELMGIPRVWGPDKSRVIVGTNVSLVNTLMNVIAGTIRIGDNAFFGHNVSLLTGTHDIDLKGLGRRVDFPLSGNDISIGRGVWVASNALVLGPCEIGDNTVIAAGSVVLPGKYEADCIYAGVPAKLVRRLASTPSLPDHAVRQAELDDETLARVQGLSLDQLIVVAGEFSAAGAFDKAMAAYRAWLEDSVSPLRYVAHYNYAVLALQTGALPLAKEQCQAALTANPEFARGLVTLGGIHERLGEYWQAVAAWGSGCLMLQRTEPLDREMLEQALAGIVRVSSGR